MDASPIRKITRNLTFIKDSICDDINTFVDGLIEADVFGMDIKDKIDTARTPKGKADVLLRIITNKGPNALNKFIDLLREKNYEQVVRKMDETATEDAGASNGSDVYRRGQTFTVTCPTELDIVGAQSQQGDDSLEATGRRIPKQTDVQSLVELQRHQYECLHSEYNQLQTAYQGAREQLSMKRDQLYKINQDKIKIESLLKSEKDENEKLKNDVAKLKSEKHDLEKDLEQKEKDLKQKEREISEMMLSMKSFEKLVISEGVRQDRLRAEHKTEIQQMLKEERESLKKELLSTISQTVQDAMKSNSNPVPTKSINSNKQRFMPGTKTTAKSSHNSLVNKNEK
ncbi:hypothetical protein ACJMK2_018065 [Sinanodonta woodiana]|uniref:CARD domain-containing protein n=1 Tax=Sinanodonta woodiana TaxID=1069815 RepID=A0ABD3UFH9_SINWO